MATVTELELLNAALCRIHRSLLNYVSECWPWTPADQTAATINAAVQVQKQHVQQLVILLEDARQTIDFGYYSTDFTDLHFVSLSYLLKQLVIQQKLLVQDLQRLSAALPGDELPAATLRTIVSEEQALIATVQALSTPQLSVTTGA